MLANLQSVVNISIITSVTHHITQHFGKQQTELRTKFWKQRIQATILSVLNIDVKTWFPDNPSNETSECIIYIFSNPIKVGVFF